MLRFLLREEWGVWRICDPSKAFLVFHVPLQQEECYNSSSKLHQSSKKKYLAKYGKVRNKITQKDQMVLQYCVILEKELQE